MRFGLCVAAWIVVAPATVWLTPGSGQTLTPRTGSSSTLAQATAPETLLDRYCITCHNERAKTGGLALDTLNVAQVGPAAEIWERVVKKIRTGMMPPSGAPHPGRAALDAFAAELEARLDRAALPAAHLATPALHRLNRTEYANAIRDLLALEVDVATLLPADGSIEGFDNIADGLSVSPSLIQGYVSAAMKISRLAVGDLSLAPSQTTYSAPPQWSQDRHIEGLPLGTRGGILVSHTFPLDADYEFSVGGNAPGAALGGLIDITLDGERMTAADPRNFRLTIPAGPHAIGIALVDRQRGAGVDEIYSDFRSDAAFTAAGGIASVTITGPFDATGVGETPSRRQVFTCRPESAREEATCARTILAALARRAYRGPVSARDVDTLMAFYAQGQKTGGFEAGIQQALARVLVSPRFVYRTVEEPDEVDAGAPYRVGDVELASRLSFFLWSSIPDDELLEVAIAGRLRNRAELEAQVRRMQADSKSEALIRNFAGQWLALRELEGVQTEAKNFDDNLRQAFRRETEMLFGAIVREDRSLLDLIDADYTFVDERLARHYGIPDVRGSYFRRVRLDADSPRRGLLGKGSMLTVTSVATRTSPVSRGKWVLENLLGTPAPVPPPGVETNLEEEAASGNPTTLRQRLEMHRANPVCASCHKIMDPMGFALENFDLVGAWREVDAGAPIDSSGELPDGTPLREPGDLRRALLDRADAVMTTATEKLLTYALGRPLAAADMPTVRSIVRRAARDQNRFSAVLAGIVESDSFQMRRKALSTRNLQLRTEN